MGPIEKVLIILLTIGALFCVFVMIHYSSKYSREDDIKSDDDELEIESNKDFVTSIVIPKRRLFKTSKQAVDYLMQNSDLLVHNMVHPNIMIYNTTTDGIQEYQVIAELKDGRSVLTTYPTMDDNDNIVEWFAYETSFVIESIEAEMKFLNKVIESVKENDTLIIDEDNDPQIRK